MPETKELIEEPKVDKRNQLNDLTAKEWIQETKSFFFQKGLGANSPEAKYEKMHPAPYPVYRYYQARQVLHKRRRKSTRPVSWRWLYCESMS